MRTISLKLPDSLDVEIRRLARRRRASKSAVIRFALEQLIARDAGPDKRSVLARAGDVVGCVEGPPDLSSNPEYLKGFGR